MPLIGRNPGELIHEVTIQTVAYVKTSKGEPQLAFTDWLTSVPAKINSVKGGEFWGSMQLQAETTNVVTLRYVEPDADHPNGITTEMWITFGTRRFNILYVNAPEERPIWLDIQCREVVGSPGLPNQAA